MKTLDEMINKLECYPVSPSTLPVSVSIVTVEDLHDAIDLLKGYQAHIKLDAVRDMLNTKNEPLSWQEINDLNHGEPVWIEWNDDDPDIPEGDWDGDWFLACYCINNPLLFIVISKNECRQYFYKDYLGKRWNVYRMERTDGEA